MVSKDVPRCVSTLFRAVSNFAAAKSAVLMSVRTLPVKVSF